MAASAAAAPGHEYVVLDVFTETPLEGNALAVFLDGRGLSESTMQRAAAELNLSETVFLLPPQVPEADSRLRIFTPTSELAFAGHPTLGAAFVLAGGTEKERVALQTGAGVIPVQLIREDGLPSFGEMEQPLPVWEPVDREDELLVALGVSGAALPVEAYRNGPAHVMVAVENEEIVRGLKPDLRGLAALGQLGVSCFAKSESGIRSRMFAPGLGVDEDPATGSAAGPLAVHLVRHGWRRFGDTVVIRQGEEIGRPSVLHARAEGSGEKPTRVTVGGAAVLVAHGHFRLS